jgi:hypothetical protein
MSEYSGLSYDEASKEAARLVAEAQKTGQYAGLQDKLTQLSQVMQAHMAVMAQQAGLTMNDDPKKPPVDPEEPEVEEPEDEGDGEEDDEDREDAMLPLPPPEPTPNYLGQIEKQYMKVGGHGVVNAFQWEPDAGGILPEWFRKMESAPAPGDWVVRHADAVSIVKPADFDRDYEAA